MKTFEVAIVNEKVNKETSAITRMFVVEPMTTIAGSAEACRLQMALDFPKECKAAGNKIAVTEYRSWTLTKAGI
jgi:hypothetical protein